MLFLQSKDIQEKNWDAQISQS